MKVDKLKRDPYAGVCLLQIKRKLTVAGAMVEPDLNIVRMATNEKGNTKPRIMNETATLVAGTTDTS